MSPSKEHPAVVDAAGTRKRLRALVRMGHPLPMIAAYVAMDESDLWDLLISRTRSIRRSVHAAAEDLFDRLWDVRVEGPVGDETRQIAIQRRWPGPLAWDDFDATDAPVARESESDSDSEVEPPILDEFQIEEAVHGRPASLTRPERLAAIRRLHAEKLHDPKIAARLRISTQTVWRSRREMNLAAIPQHTWKESA